MQRGRENIGSSDINIIHLGCRVSKTRSSTTRQGGDRGGVSYLWVVEIEGKRRVWVR
jgi:hypothetical protein